MEAATPQTTRVESVVGEVLPTLTPEEDLSSSAARLASICSLLAHFGVVDEECIADMYTLIALALRNAPADYVEGFAETVSRKKRGVEALVDLFGEDGFKTILEYLASDQCSKNLLAELLVDIMEAEEFSSDARREVVKMLPKLTCRQLKGLIIASLLVPPGEEEH